MKDLYFGKNAEVAFRVIEGEAVILTPSDGRVHNLNEVAARVFELANGKRTMAEICRCVAEEFSAEAAEVEKDLRLFLEDMVHKKILVISDTPL